MSSEQAERKAVMNPDAVNEARVFSGLVYYFNRRKHIDIEIQDSPFVEVGKWTAAGEEQAPEDYDCTYYAAVLLGYENNILWLPAEEGMPAEDERTGERKLLIHNGHDEGGKIIPFSPRQSIILAEKINLVLEQARLAKLTLECFP